MAVGLVPAQGALRVLRGAGLATTSASLSVAAHAAADGSLPDPGVTAVVTLLLAGAGVALADRRRGSLGIVGALGFSQVSLHAFLQLMGSHQHGIHHHGLPFAPLPMLLGHMAAVLLTGLLLARAEDALFVVARFLGRILPRKTSPLLPVTPLRTICIPADTVRVHEQLVRQRINGLRGPPPLSC